MTHPSPTNQAQTQADAEAGNVHFPDLPPRAPMTRREALGLGAAVVISAAIAIGFVSGVLGYLSTSTGL